MPSKICLFVQRAGLVCFFWGSNGSMISHYESLRLLEYGTGWSTTLPPNLSFSPEIPNGFYNILESSFEVMVVNAQHIKNVPGRKTDVKDAEWIAELTRHGLLRGSLIPPLPQRDLRDLTRQRTTLVRERASVVNRLQKVLEWAKVKLASVVTDITGVSARSMLKALAEGQNEAHVLATYAKASLVRKRIELEKALQGQVREHHRFLIASHLTHLEFLEEQIAVFDR